MALSVAAGRCVIYRFIICSRAARSVTMRRKILLPYATHVIDKRICDKGGALPAQTPTTDAVWGGNLGTAFFGPDFDIVTPEPCSILLPGTGLFSIGFVLRKRLFT